MYENGSVNEMMEEDLPVFMGSEDKWCVSTAVSDNHLSSFDGV